MFLRIRGKGACPENSQATLLHLRGFRHVQCPPPTGSYTVATVPSAASITTESPAAAQAPAEVTSCQFQFTHFAMGLQAPSVVDDQRRFRASSVASADVAGQPVNTFLPMVWKELWNAYDICYDEVPLLPGDYLTTNEQLKKLTEKLDAVPVLPVGFTLPSTRTGNAKAVVCTHYCSQHAWTHETFNAALLRAKDEGEQARQHCAAAPAASAVLVIDLADLPKDSCGSRLAVSLAWALGFASLQEDNVLLRAAAVVVRLPYTSIPQATAPPPSHGGAASGAGGDLLSALSEMRAFLAQHIQLVLAASCVALAAGDAVPQPPIAFIGNDPATLGMAVQTLLSTAAVARGADIHEMVVLRTDEHDGDGDDAAHRTEAEAVLNAVEEEAAAVLAAAVRAACEDSHVVRTVQALVAPVRALIAGGEEPWDPYTLKERSRLNFCPCCGNCGIAEQQEGSDEGAGHHHHHHQDGHDHGH